MPMCNLSGLTTRSVLCANGFPLLALSLPPLLSSLEPSGRFLSLLFSIPGFARDKRGRALDADDRFARRNIFAILTLSFPTHSLRSSCQLSGWCLALQKKPLSRHFWCPSPRFTQGLIARPRFFFTRSRPRREFFTFSSSSSSSTIEVQIENWKSPRSHTWRASRRRRDHFSREVQPEKRGKFWVFSRVLYAWYSISRRMPSVNGELLVCNTATSGTNFNWIREHFLCAKRGENKMRRSQKTRITQKMGCWVS